MSGLVPGRSRITGSEPLVASWIFLTFLEWTLVKVASPLDSRSLASMAPASKCAFHPLLSAVAQPARS